MSAKMVPEFVIGIDPGKMTGVCAVQMVDGSPHVLESLELDFDAYVAWLEDALGNWYPSRNSVVVCERYIVTAQSHKNGQAPWSLEGTGAARSAVSRYWGRPLEMSHTNAKKFSTNQKLKAVGMWHKGGDGHANDALRHALHYLVSAGWKDPRLLQSS